MFNRKLLCSVFNAQEAREAVLGGARIIDSEDPKSALGNIKPQHIMAVSDAVLDFRRDLDAPEWCGVLAAADGLVGYALEADQTLAAANSKFGMSLDIV